MLNKKSLDRHQRIRESKEVLRPKGRPRRNPEKVKKANGRPRKYNIEPFPVITN